MFTPVALAFAVVAATASVYAQTLPDNCARTYVVQPGDFCDGISAAQNASTFQLANVNKFIDPLCDNLQPGETLCLGITGQDCTVTTVVAEGSSCVDIANTAGTSLDTLLANNPNVDENCSNIYPGEVLCTAKEVIVGST
ncbi:hypothetical protein K474DRAFT_1660365 [Panus rudis PR-1116 ss-1]|nr:hypothetical protein K474DRAFT_1660365 [Panus rudis PR-1116 ss-1]